MKTKHIIELLDYYYSNDKYFGLIKCESQNTSKNLDLEQTMRHGKWCCKRAVEFAQYGKIDKAMRWLGFVQGVLSSKGLCTIDELKDHNTETVC